MILDRGAVRKTWIFLGAIAAIETLTILAWPKVFLSALWLRAGEVPIIGWVLAVAVTGATILYTARALDLGPLLRVLIPFKLLGLLIAIPSSILEEAFFRMTVMNLLALQHYGIATQILASALTFGAVHAVWAIKGGMRSLVSAVVSTTVLGAMLSVVYLASARAIVPCVVAHFFINLVLEPWLGYAYALRTERATSKLYA